MKEIDYLTGMPQNLENFGLCKVLNVRYEVIHWKHIFTEIFVRKTINLEKQLFIINWSIFQYLEYYTNQLRKIHKFTRQYIQDINLIVKSERNSFFKCIDLLKGNNNTIILDFDGICTNTYFKKNLYELCIQRCKVIICSANPTITEKWFIDNNLSLPFQIYSCKGKVKKLKILIELNKKYDYCFYIDNELCYLDFAWVFGLKTFHYKNKKIIYYSLKTK